MKIKRELILLFAIVVCFSGMMYSNDFALADRDLEIDYPTAPSDSSGDPVVTPSTTKTTLPEYIKYLFNFLIGIGGILAFAVFVYGGVMWTFSAGNPGIIAPAKKKMINGGMGLALLLCSYLIIYTINPDLTVMRLGLDWVSTHGPEIIPSETDPKDYQETPIGLLVEDIVAKNISCFDKDKNLINCRTKEIIAEPIDDIFDRDAHYNYCYEYDHYGNKITLMEYHDRLDCVKELTKAIGIKSAKLKAASEELKIIVNSECKCVNCNGPGDCYCQGADNCFCCGSPREEEPPSCSGNPPTPTLKNDPCTLAGREEIDELRNEIYQIINGTERKIQGKDIVDDPGHDTKNLSLIEAQERFKKLKEDFNKELNELKEAEELVKFPSYVKRLNLAQYLEKKTLKKLEKEDFKNFSPPGYDSIARYCKIFNCQGKTEDPNIEYEIEDVSVITIIDRSGSMFGQGIQDVKQGVTLFLDLMEKDSLEDENESEAGVVSFANSARVDCSITSDFGQAKNALSSINAIGSTNMGAALNISIQELKNNAEDDTDWNIIYFTDGNITEGASEEQILNNIVPVAINADITIYTIGYGQNINSINHNFLKKVAQATGGEYHSAPGLDELEDIYKKLYVKIIHGNEPIIPITEGEICYGYSLNDQGILCNLFVLDGAPSTFYHNIKEYEKHK